MRLPWRRLLPTGLLTAAGIAAYTIGSALYLPHIFTENAERYGLIGIAFGLVTWLFAYAWVVITCSVVSPPPRGSARTSETTTAAPSAASRTAIARPSPDEEPVTTATRPLRRPWGSTRAWRLRGVHASSGK